MDRIQMLTKARNALLNLVNSPNYTESFKLSRIDELTSAYKFQLTKAIEEGDDSNDYASISKRSKASGSR